MSLFVPRRDSSCRTQMDLLKPPEGAERAIATLRHYYITSEAPGMPKATHGKFKLWELAWEHIF